MATAFERFRLRLKARMGKGDALLRRYHLKDFIGQPSRFGAKDQSVARAILVLAEESFVFGRKHKYALWICLSEKIFNASVLDQPHVLRVIESCSF